MKEQGEKKNLSKMQKSVKLNKQKKTKHKIEPQKVIENFHSSPRLFRS
jgi:hypothetical protein